MCVVFIACVTCNIAFIAFVACDISFVAFIACDKCNKSDIAFVASIFYPTPFLDTPFIPRRRGGHHRRNDNDNGYRCGLNRGGCNAGGGGGEGEGGGGIVGRAIEGVHLHRPSLWPSPSSTSAIINVGHRHAHRLVGHRRGRLRVDIGGHRHRPSSWPSMSGTCGGGLMAKRGGTNLIISFIYLLRNLVLFFGQ